MITAAEKVLCGCVVGSGVVQFLSGSPLIKHKHGFSIKRTTTPSVRCSNWDSNAEKAYRPNRFDFNLQDDDADDDESFSFRDAAKKRVWWSDNIQDDEDDDDEDEFGFGEASLGFTSVFKIFKAFGWMVPAIGISMLVGTGPNAFLMALALPLAQSALSLITDTLGGGWADNPRPRSRSRPRPKKRTYSRSASNVGTSQEKEQNTRTEKGREHYKGNRNTNNFGGWDDLDRDRRRRSEKVPPTTPTQKGYEPTQEKNIKLRRRVRNREKPLLLRLLIAVFPFLGSWTKLF